MSRRLRIAVHSRSDSWTVGILALIRCADVTHVERIGAAALRDLRTDVLSRPLCDDPYVTATIIDVAGAGSGSAGGRPESGAKETGAVTHREGFPWLSGS
jgi:hypothetical protein